MAPASRVLHRTFSYGTAVAAVSVLWGRAYEHLLLDPPYAHLLAWVAWGEGLDESTRRLLVSGLQWHGGMVCLLTGLLFFFPFIRNGRWIWPWALMAMLVLALHAALGPAGDSYWPQWIEHGSQIAVPLLAVAGFRWPDSRLLFLLVCWAIALTFLGHGLFALGVYPTPGHFTYMVEQLLGLSAEQSGWFLRVAGALDLVVVLGLGWSRYRVYVLSYAALWGLITSLARPLTYLEFGADAWERLHQYGLEFWVRVPHFLLPLLALWALSYLLPERSEARATREIHVL